MNEQEGITLITIEFIWVDMLKKFMLKFSRGQTTS